MKSLTVELASGVFQKLNIEDLVKHGAHLFEFLCFLDINDIEEYVFQSFYKRKPQHNIGAMLRLAAAYYIHGCSGYRKLVKSLTESDLKLLKLKKAPSGSRLQQFIQNQIGEENFVKIMHILAKKLDYFAEQNGTNYSSQDSTPLEASRYDDYADYNEHYGCKMDKAHITMKGTYPLLLTHTCGNANDSPPLEPHLITLNELDINTEFMNLDGQYDSYENHALVRYVIGAYPYIHIRENAVEHEDGTIKKIDHWCNKLWKFGGNPNDTIANKLQFLFDQGRLKQVGAYYRNKNLKEGMPKDKTNLRKVQERIHSHIKQTVKFDIRYLHNSNKSLHIIASFVSYQLLVLAASQNGLNPNEFGFIGI